MGLRNIVQVPSTNPLANIGMALKNLTDELRRVKGIVNRDCIKLNGYSMQRRELPTPGVYLVNQIDGDPNFGTATFIGP